MFWLLMSSLRREARVGLVLKPRRVAMRTFLSRERLSSALVARFVGAASPAPEEAGMVRAASRTEDACEARTSSVMDLLNSRQSEE
jgi:hypothetical protein